MTDADKIMFEIFRVAGASRDFRVVYYTELDDHDRDVGISQALAGEHVFDGFIAQRNAAEAKAAIAILLNDLNQGEDLDAHQVAGVIHIDPDLESPKDFLINVFYVAGPFDAFSNQRPCIAIELGLCHVLKIVANFKIGEITDVFVRLCDGSRRWLVRI